MKPVILFDNRFLDGVPVATDTAPGFSALNLVDLKPFTFWKADSQGGRYISVDCGTDKPADALGIIGHDLSSLGGAVSVEASYDGVDWFEQMSPYAPLSDKAFLNLFPETVARHWRLLIDSPLAAPTIACVLLGSRMTFPFPVDAPFAPVKEQVETVGKKSKAGHLLAHHVKYKPYTISAKFSYVDREWVDSVFLPFWQIYGSELHPFFWAWDLDTYPQDVRFVRFDPGYTYAPPVSVLQCYDSLTLELEGVREAVAPSAPPLPPPILQ